MKNILDFIESCTDCWHTAAELASTLDADGFIRLDEGEYSKLSPGGKYYIIRNMSSVIAFKLPDSDFTGYMITAAHGESPAFKLKPKPELTDNEYIRLNVEGYGGMRLETWLDRPLSVSGRVITDNGGALTAKLIRLDRDALIIPSLAPHLDRNCEKGNLNIRNDMPPLYALSASGRNIMNEIAESAGASADNIKGFDLMLYNRERGRIWGADNEFISAPRLDDLQCVYALLDGFLNCVPSSSVQVLCMFDNEEIGSGTRQGAKSDFLPSTLRRISESLGKSYSEHMRCLNSSFMLSADNAHAIHPNRRDVYDAANYPVIGGGIVIKYSAAQRYTTDAVSDAIFRSLCDNNKIPYQVYANRSDIAGGSTLGILAAENTCISTIDVGLAQLAMHSAYETAGNADTEYLSAAAKRLYESTLEVRNGCFKLSQDKF